MAAFEVRMSDRFENTGLDGQFFATRQEAEQAVEVTAEWHEGFDGVVFECKDQEPTTTFTEWSAKGW
jgi:hypothetical protein